MAETSAALVLQPPAEQLSIVKSSSPDGHSSTLPAASSLATLFEQPSEHWQDPITTSAADDVEAPSLTTPPPPFLSLPCDIHHLILTDYLPYPSVLALRSTTSHFSSLLAPQRLKRLRRTIVAGMLAEEHTILQKWAALDYLRHPRVAYMNCYLCLQSRPITDFFQSQVVLEKDLARKDATRRWCKPCGLKYGKVGHGRWRKEVVYGDSEQSLYENVVGAELNVKNTCQKCPPGSQSDIDQVWWGCVGCFEKEYVVLSKGARERWRNLRASCRGMNEGYKALVKPATLFEFACELSLCGRDALKEGTLEIHSWATKRSLFPRAPGTSGRGKRVLDPKRKIQQAGQKLGTKVKRAAGAALVLAKKTHKRGEAYSPGDLEAPVAGATADGLMCCADAGAPEAPAAEIEPNPARLTAAAPPSSVASQTDPQTCLPSPRHQVRCLRCWSAKGYAYSPVHRPALPKGRWCSGCLVDHKRFVASERERKRRREPAYLGPEPGTDHRRMERETGEEREEDDGANEEEKEPQDLPLWMLFWQP